MSKRVLIIITFLHLVNCKAGVFQSFINQNLKHVTVCNGNQESTDYIDHEFVDIFNQNYLWLKHWNCLYSEIPELHDGLIVLDQITPKEMTTIFTKKGIQSSLKANIWLVQSINSSLGIIDFFKKSPFKLGLNAKIFAIDNLNNVIQIIGTGRHDADSKVCDVYNYWS